MNTPPPIRTKEYKNEYFVQINDEQMGPYDLEKIKVLLEFKNINENTLIWKDGMVDWDKISNLNEFAKQIIPINSSNTEIKSIDQDEPKEHSVGKNYIKWVYLFSVITLITSFLGLIGAIQQYLQFENTKEIDMHYIAPFSAWGSLITILISLISFIYLIIKKKRYYISCISMLVSVSAILLLTITESSYRDFWEPIWDSNNKLYNLGEQENESIRNGWRTGKIDSDSLSQLIQLIDLEHTRKMRLEE